MAVLHLHRFAQHRRAPVHVLEPVARRRRGEQVRAEFREQVARHLHAVRVRDRGGTQPARDATDALHVGHHVVVGAGVEGLREFPCVEQVLATLDRRAEFRGDTRVAGVVVVAHGLLDPVETFVVEHAAAQDRLVPREPLVEVGHDRDAIAEAVLHGAHRGEILRRVVAPDAQFHGREAAFRRERLRLVGDAGDRLDPESAAVVGLDRLHRSAEQHGERHAADLRRGIPGAHVEARERESDEAGGVDQRVPLAQLRVEVERRDGVTDDERRDAVDEFDDRLLRGRREREEVRAAGDAGVGLEVDEHERCAGHGAGGGGGRQTEGREHGAGADVPDRDDVGHGGFLGLRDGIRGLRRDRCDRFAAGGAPPSGAVCATGSATCRHDAASVVSTGGRTVSAPRRGGRSRRA